MFELEKDTPVTTPAAAPKAEQTVTTPSPTAPATQPSVTPPAPTKVAIEGVGEVDVDELKKGYLRQQDYTRKTQELAAERQRMESDKSATPIEERVSNLLADKLGRKPEVEDPYVRLSQIDPEQRPFDYMKAQNEVIRQQAEEQKALRKQTEELNKRFEGVTTKEELGKLSSELSWREQEKAITAVAPEFATNPFVRGQTMALLHPSGRGVPSTILGGAKAEDLSPEVVAQKVVEFFDNEATQRAAAKAAKTEALKNNLPSGAAPRGFTPTPVDEINKHPIGSPERAAALADYNRKNFEAAKARGPGLNI
jgi:hypothetical protein